MFFFLKIESLIIFGISLCQVTQKILKPKAKTPKPIAIVKPLRNPRMERGTAPWIAISGYPSKRAFGVYNFFVDIGCIVEKYYCDPNIMYLKYFCMKDCKMALSYDNQKIGYGGDILVRVKAKNPIFETRIETVIEQKVEFRANRRMPISVIDIETAERQQSETRQQHIYQRRQAVPAQNQSFMQWLKRKILFLLNSY